MFHIEISHTFKTTTYMMWALITAVITSVLGDTIPLTVLYEKKDKNGPRYLEIVLRDVLDGYNKELLQTGIELAISGVADYSIYSQIPEYKRLAGYAGSEDILGRMSSLENIQKNIILLIASPEPGIAEQMSRVAPCNTRLFIDINLENKIETVATKAIVKWLRRLLGMNVKDPFQSSASRKFPHDLKNIDLRERFARCAEMEYEQARGNDSPYFKRKSSSRPNRLRRYDTANSTSEIAERSNRWDRDPFPETSQLRAIPLSSHFGKSPALGRQPIEKENPPVKPSPKIQLGTPLSMSTQQKNTSLKRPIYSQNSWKTDNLMIESNK